MNSPVAWKPSLVTFFVGVPRMYGYEWVGCCRVVPHVVDPPKDRILYRRDEIWDFRISRVSFEIGVGIDVARE